MRTASMASSISHPVHGLTLVTSGHVIFVINYYVHFHFSSTCKLLSSIVCNLVSQWICSACEFVPVSCENGDPGYLFSYEIRDPRPHFIIFWGPQGPHFHMRLRTLLYMKMGTPMQFLFFVIFGSLATGYFINNSYPLEGRITERAQS